MASYSKYPMQFQSSLLQSQLSLSMKNNRMPMIMNVPINPLMMNQMQKQTNDNKKVWVGKIPDGVSDTFMLRLLETCGTVVSWKRVTDSKGKQNSFGICEYLTVESMLKSLRLLNNFPIDNSELQVKVGAETEEFLKKWRERKKLEWIDSLRIKGIEPDLEEIRRKEEIGEPLEWELELVSKDTNSCLISSSSSNTNIFFIAFSFYYYIILFINFILHFCNIAYFYTLIRLINVSFL